MRTICEYLRDTRREVPLAAEPCRRRGLSGIDNTVESDLPLGRRCSIIEVFRRVAALSLSDRKRLGAWGQFVGNRAPASMPGPLVSLVHTRVWPWRHTPGGHSQQRQWATTALACGEERSAQVPCRISSLLCVH